jgi:hypothetical protein
VAEVDVPIPAKGGFAIAFADTGQNPAVLECRQAFVSQG